MQFAAPAHFERIGRIGIRNAKRDVGFQLAHQPVADLPRGNELALFAAKRRVVHEEEHRNRRLVHGDGVNALGRAGIRDRVADVQIVDTRNADDVAGAGFLNFDALQALEGEQRR